MSSYISWIVIPLTAGIVGYITNAIAIKMLFRPYKPHWYTLGWQGIIPRTRSALAGNVAKVVGEKLLTEHEIKNALLSEDVRHVLYVTVYKVTSGYDSPEAKKEISEKIRYNLDMLLRAVADSLAANEELCGSIDTYSAKIMRKVLSAVLRLPCSTVAEWAQTGVRSAQGNAFLAQLRLYAEKEAREAINNFIYSGKSVADLSGDLLDTAAIASKMAEQILPMLKDFLSTPSVLDRLSSLLIAYKEEQFASENVLKRAAVNMFLSDEKIVAMVHTKAPELADKITSDGEIRRNITELLEQKLKEIFTKPLSDYAAQLGDTYYKFLHTLSALFAAKAVPVSIAEKIASLAETYDGLTLCDAFAGAGITVNSVVPESVAVSRLLLSGSLGGYIKEAVSGNISDISLSQSQVEALSAAITDWILHILIAFVPQALRHLNITGVVEEKINSLDIGDVEDMLFSFMRSHFRWINGLGFIIGFVIGLGQMIFIRFFS